VLQIPSVTNALHNFLQPTFRDSHLYETLEPSAAASWIGLAVGAAIAVAGIALAWRLWGDGRLPVHIRTRFAALHRFFVNKWFFDEAIDGLVVQPAAWVGRFAASTFERVVVSGALVGGSSGAIRALSAAVRGLQSGYVRYYAALLLVGLTGLSFYFLVSA
jgi:NADH-quinone oxidoreductase subunit L